MGMMLRRHYTSTNTEIKSGGRFEKTEPPVTDKVEDVKEVKKPKKTITSKEK